jgi:hypothetical protein
MDREFLDQLMEIKFLLRGIFAILAFFGSCTLVLGIQYQLTHGWPPF